MAVWISFAMIGSATAQEEEGPDSAIVQKVDQLGGKVMKIAQNEGGLEVYFHLGRNHDGLRQFESPKPGAPKPPALDGELGLLKEVENLVWLHLGGTDVTDQGLPHLAGLTSLTRLHLERTKVSDAGLAHLKDLQNLAYLNLYQTGITDAGLAHLEGLKGLKNLYLWQAKVTEAGVEKLQQALPDCKIDVGWKESEAPEEEETGRRGKGREEGREVLVRLLKAAAAFAAYSNPRAHAGGFLFRGTSGCRLRWARLGSFEIEQPG